MEKSIQDLAAQVRDQFESRTRDNGDVFWCRKTEYRDQDWIMNLVHKAHNDMLPDDHKYEFVIDALDLIQELSDPDEPEIEPDIYNHDLIKWLGSHLSRIGYCDQYMEDYGADTHAGIVRLLQGGQQSEKMEVYNIVLQALRDRLEELEDEEGEDNEVV